MKKIVCKDCRKLLAYLKGVPADTDNQTTTLCYECALERSTQYVKKINE